MAINIKKLIKENSGKDAKVGEGFSDTRGYFPEEPGIPKHNGLNVNNDPAHVQEKEAEKKRKGEDRAR